MSQPPPAPSSTSPATLRAHAETRTLLTHNAVLLTLTSVSSALALAMQAIVARMLGPDDFGVVASVLALMFVLSILSTSIQANIARTVASLRASGEDVAVAWHIASKLVVSAAYAAALAALILAVSPLGARFLHTDAVVVMALAPAMITNVMLPVARGGLQGDQRFVALGLSFAAEAALRLALAVLFVWAGLGPAGALLAYGLAGAVMLALAAPSVRPAFGRIAADAAAAATAVRSMAGPIFTTNLALILMAALDVVAARRFLDAGSAGTYAGMALLARAVLYASQAVPQVLLPRAVEAQADARSPLRIFATSIALTGVIGAAALAVFAVAPSPLIRTLLGDEFAADRATLLLLGGSSAAMSLALLFANFSFAAGDRRVWIAPAVALAAEVVLFALHHGSPRAIAVDALAPAACLLAWSAAVTVARRKHLFDPA